MGGGRVSSHQVNKQSIGPSANNLYSLQQAAGYNSLSLNANGTAMGQGQIHTLNYARGGGTLIVTREDFNIEDIHCQMVYKVQRNNQLLREIEGLPSDKLELPDDLHDLHGSPQLVEIVDNDEIICGDMCNKPAINWGRGKPIEQRIDNMIPTNQSRSNHPKQQQLSRDYDSETQQQQLNRYKQQQEKLI